MTAAELMELLAAKHSDAVFVPECKLGSSWNGARRLDAWALLKTWSPLTAIGYEVKVARSDFLGDRKWTEYLGACHEFNFVCPKGLIQPEELPEGVGLLWAVGRRLLTKRKAVRHALDHERTVALMSYVLMSRSRTVADMHEANRPDNGGLDYWRSWLALKAEKQTVGHAASARLRELVREERRLREAAQREADRASDIRRVLEELGFDGNVSSWRLRREATGKHAAEALREVRTLAQRLLALAGEGE